MSDDKQKEILNGYEQLKRKNRRRLVGVSGLVLISSILLGSALNMGDDKAEANAIQVASSIQNEQTAAKVKLSQAPVLEPTSNHDEQLVKSKSTAKVEAENIEVIKEVTPEKEEPATVIQAPADIEPPLVLINDKLVDSDIKGLEESERIQKAEAAKREANELRAQEKREQLALQREVKRKEALDEAAAKKRLALAKFEREVEKKSVAPVVVEKTIEKKVVRPSESKVVVAEKDMKKEVQPVKPKEVSNKAETKVESAKVVVAKKVEKANVEQTKSVKAPVESAKVVATPKQDMAKAKSTQSTSNNGQKAAIQAGYPEKERALSLQRKMKDAGIKASVVEINTDKGKVYRVKTAPYSSRETAGRDLEKMRIHGIAGAVVNE